MNLSCSSLVNIQKRITQGLKVLSYFVVRKFEFINKRVLQLDNYLSESDKLTFYTFSLGYDMDDFLFNAYMGLKKYVMKENPEHDGMAKFRINW